MGLALDPFGSSRDAVAGSSLFFNVFDGRGEYTDEAVSYLARISHSEAAMRVVTRKGYDHVTVQDIADEAGIAKGTVYLMTEKTKRPLARGGRAVRPRFHLQRYRRPPPSNEEK